MIPARSAPPLPPPNGSSAPSLWCGVVVGCFPLPVVVSCGWGVGLLRLVPHSPLWCGAGLGFLRGSAWRVSLVWKKACTVTQIRLGNGRGDTRGGGGSVSREPGSYIISLGDAKHSVSLDQVGGCKLYSPKRVCVFDLGSRCLACNVNPVAYKLSLCSTCSS